MVPQKNNGLFSSVLSAVLVGLVRAYQLLLSPYLPQSCRYTPSCSAYMITAIKGHGPFRGTWLGLKRIGRCHPWGGHGHDPVPPRAAKERQS